MATSPAPDAAAPPGMCPGVAVLGGGGAGGDGDGDGSGGKDGAGGGGNGNGEGAGGDGKSADGAPDPAKYPTCGTASHPVDVVTGRAFTHPITDLELPGPLRLVFARMYSSKMADRDVGLGFGWGHSFGWQIEVARREIIVWSEQGVAVRFPRLEVGQEHIGPWAWLLRRTASGYSLDVDDGVARAFEASDERERTYRLASVVDRNRNRISLRYEDQRLAELEDSVGRVVRVRGTPDGRIAAIEVKNAVAQGQWIAFGAYTYDEHGNLVSATDADGYTARYSYDDERRLASDTDRTGLCFHFVYDRNGRCIESWGDYPGKRDPSLIDERPSRLADGVTIAKGIHHCRFSYLPGGYSEVADSTQVRRFFGNKHGTLDKSIDGGGVLESTYRQDGHILSTHDPMGGLTLFERDERGRLLKVTDPLGRDTLIERNADGAPVVITDASGGVTRVERDPRGNAVVVQDPLGAVTAWRYDERGLPTEHVSPLGLRTTCTYDTHGNLLSIRIPNGGVYRFTYDALGRRLSRTDPLGATTGYAYSSRGDLIAVRDALGGVARYTYDGEGHLTRAEDASGQRTELAWGGYHKLCDRKDANGNTVKMRYNREGELVEVHNEQGEVHRMAYTLDGKLKGEVTFDGRKLWYRHDLAGRVIRVENGAHEVMEIEYDLAGQLVKRDLNGEGAEEFTYDACGRIIAAKGPGGEVRFERDASGRIGREAQVVLGKEHWTEVTYDEAGERIGRKTSLGHTEATTRGLLGERTRTVLDGREQIEHQVDLLGREIARALPGGGWLQSQYDAVGRVSRRRAGSAAVAGESPVRAGEPDWLGTKLEKLTVDMAYRYDATGEMVESVSAGSSGGGRTQYTYDPVGQMLAMVPETARSELFRYDATGNLHESGEGAAERVYGPGNRLLRQGDTEYVWDEDGRLQQKRMRSAAGKEEVWRYSWNAAGLLSQVDRPDGLRAEFGYDPFARRLWKKVTRAGDTRLDRVPVSAVRFVWDGDVLVHEIERRAREDGDPITSERTYWFEDAGFTPVAHRQRQMDDVMKADRWLHYVNDPVGTPTALLGGDGSVASDLGRKAWGQTTNADREHASTNLRLQGQYEDEETGLRYNRFRYFSGADGRFVSADPIGLRGGMNPFAYGRNPLRWVDPLGLGPPTQKQQDRAAQVAQTVSAQAQAGNVQSTPGAHPQDHGFTPPMVQDILANPDAVYLSHGRECKMTFQKGGDVVVTTGPGAGQGRVITAYGSSGIKGPSGAAALGGSATDPGAPVTAAQITGGTIPVAPGSPPIAPATRVA